MFSICIIAALTTQSFGMFILTKKLHKKNCAYVMYRQSQNEEQATVSSHANNQETLFSEKETDAPLEALTSSSEESEETVQSKSIFSRLLDYFTPVPATVEVNSHIYNGNKIEMSENRCIKQIYVTNQFGTHGGGDASCGYQSLKNAIYLIKALQESSTTESLNNDLNNLTIINTLFGPVHKNSVGTWRAIIMQKRALIVFKNYIYQRLELKKLDEIQENTCIQFESKKRFLLNKSKIREVFATLLNKYAQEAAEALTNGQTTQLYINPELIIEYIQNNLNPEVIQDPQEFIEESSICLDENPSIECHDLDELFGLLYTYLRENNTIDTYINLSSIKTFELSLDNSKEAFDLYNNNNSNPSQLDGDWLQEEEIYALKNLEAADNIHCMKESRNGLLHGLDYKFTIIEDVNDLTGTHGDTINHEIFQEIELKSQKGINKAKTALAADEIKKYIHAFIVGTADRSRSTHGHWFVLLLYKHDNMHEYIVMDSANNANRLYDERVKKIISLLENQDLTDKIVASPEELKELENKIRTKVAEHDLEALDLIENYKQCGGTIDFSEETQALFS